MGNSTSKKREIKRKIISKDIDKIINRYLYSDKSWNGVMEELKSYHDLIKLRRKELFWYFDCDWGVFKNVHNKIVIINYEYIEIVYVHFRRASFMDNGRRIKGMYYFIDDDKYDPAPDQPQLSF